MEPLIQLLIVDRKHFEARLHPNIAFPNFIFYRSIRRVTLRISVENS